MKHHEQVVWRFGADVVVAGTPAGLHRVLTGPGVEMWRLLQTDRQFGEVVDLLAAQFFVDRSVVERDIAPVIEELRRDGFLDG